MGSLTTQPLVYTALSGCFKAHVDTPCLEQRFGSLVMCLLCSHNGEAPVVRYTDNMVTHD